MPEYIKTTGGYFYKTYKNGKSVRVSKDEYERNNKIVGGGWNPFSRGTTKSTGNNRGSLQRQKGFKAINPISNMRHIQFEEWHNNNNNRGSSSETKFNLKPKQTIVNNFIKRSIISKSIAQNAQNAQNGQNGQKSLNTSNTSNTSNTFVKPQLVRQNGQNANRSVISQ
jgi:hypothetical protein